ncbi:sel1 repeat family protein [Acidithiobacillus sp. HP-6]|uniref:tetratricopeptide repeat protein n=1 Tax=unclassified Acidithiobacillus TaxID=2614800 RepID=UPI001879E3AF|nr:MULTISPECIES: tetratricopeptide repeat protein [unclassified Acidithiobacillus]MBE7562714.1 sel1 repeat family protein [Acidithiobacillus sp. HP-6]MBE7570490.1 sel1 repeat family protein [Acidithiobacillus sp. HP-2]
MRTRIVIPLALMGLFSVGSAYAMTNIQAKDLMMAATHKGNTTDLAKLESAAKSGDAVAQRWLGVYWSASDSAKADYWFKKSAAQGNAWAEESLGLAYFEGQGVPQNYEKANYWFKKSAAQGNADAEANLGVDYSSGYGVPQNTMTAIKWWKEAAAQGGTEGALAQYEIHLAERG